MNLTEANNGTSYGKTILSQIGNAALFMMGAKNIGLTEKGVTFQIRGSKAVSHVRVDLDLASDTYTVTFYKIVGLNIKSQETRKGIYSENLNSLISNQTGLALSL